MDIPFLPNNYFWIPNFNHRYAMHWNPATKNIEPKVFSVVFPGYAGTPRPVNIRETHKGDTVQLAAIIGWDKNTYRVKDLIKNVEESAAFKMAKKTKAGKKDGIKFVDAAIARESQLTKGNTMNLPEHYYWIPGFNNRYAVRENTTTGVGFYETVYSFVSPGAKGLAIPLKTNLTMDGLAVRLAWHVGGLKDSYTIRSLIKMVTNSPEYNKAQQATKCKPAKAVDMPYRDAASEKPVTAVPKKVWMIGIMKDDGSISFSNMPKQHATKTDAYAEAERLAPIANQKVVVVETIRVVQASKLSIFDL